MKQSFIERCCKKIFSPLKKLLKDHGPEKLIGIAILILLIIIFFHSLQTLLATAFLFILAVFSTFYTKFTHFSIGFELRTLLFVITGIKLGIVPAITLTLLAILLGLIISMNFQPSSMITPLTYLLLAVILPIIKGLDIATIGFIITILYNIILQFFYVFIFQYPVSVSLPPLVGNLLFNTIIFARFGEVFLAMFP
ncbi:hypothetical protein J4460_07650 [Candidatus Woesearchaeota archaeon]|nr:MAG: hypothetical protein QS99_C0011G0009 [archaeon GW2011_AR4]MBS3130512.1 hypothetical protein [Candidatus Woesearchaeota archaeon]HIH37992.1 hypothetical protein [Candidatus Woesearchaeota archaeon]HIH48661.1 hypothetical protein [Candidatus Woesearchaeota archaeon]HIJ02961.1 hypothetical protein [Candidatus Woesearchaeota archaeon]